MKTPSRSRRLLKTVGFLPTACAVSVLLFHAPGVSPIYAQDAAADGAGAAAGADGDPPAQNEAIDKEFQDAVDEAALLRSFVDGKLISASEALRITLLRQPAIHLAQEDVELAEAAVLNAVAPFDTLFTSEIKHGRSYNPLPDAQIEAQREAKKNLEAISREVKRTRAGSGDGRVEITETDDRGRQRTRTIDISNLSAGGFSIAGAPSGPSGTEVNLSRQLENQANFLNTTVPSVATSNLALDATALRTNLENSRNQTLSLLDSTLDRTLDEFKIQTTAQGNSSNYSLGVTKLTRAGIIFFPHVDWQRNGTDNSASINFDMTIPLMQGRGAITQRAGEDAAIVDLDASKWQLRFEVANAMLNTLFSFWNCLSAQQDLTLLMHSEDIARSNAELSRLRVDNGDMSEGEAVKAESRLAVVEGQRIVAEFTLLDARHQLGLAIGLDGEELIDPPYAAGQLPGPINPAPLDAMSTPDLMLKDLGNQRLVEEYSASGAPLRIEATLEHNPENHSGYQWTSGEGPAVTIFSGTPVSATVIVGEKRPLDYVIPIIKNLVSG